MTTGNAGQKIRIVSERTIENEMKICQKMCKTELNFQKFSEFLEKSNIKWKTIQFS